MASRRPTLSDPIDLAIAREIDSKYDDVKIVADNIDKVVVVADSIDSIDRIDDIMTIANEVVTVAEIQAEIVALAEIVEGISALYDDIDVLNSLYADKAKLDSIFADKETLDSLYADKATLDSLYAYKTRLDVLYLNLVQINRVYQSITAVDRVALSADNVDVVADDIVSVNTVSSNINNVVTVSNNIGNVNAVGTDIDSVVAVAQSVVPNLDEILLVDELAVQVATDRDDVAAMKLAVEAVYDSFDDRFLGAKENDPTVDNDGMPLLDGAMYFNTSSNTLKVYDAGNAVWIIIPQLYLSGLLDVTLTSITTGDVLNWNGSKWVNTRTPSFDSVKLNGGSGAEGLLSWNADEGTVDLGLPGGSLLQIGQENVRTVRNSTSSTITNGTVCMFNGTIGNSGRIKVKPFTGGFNEAMYVYGVATQDIAAGADGLITIGGKVRGIDTTGASVGEVWLDEDVLYAKPGDSGKLTKIVPNVSELRMPIASVIKAHTNGVLEIRFIPLNENQFEPRNANIQTHISRTDNPHNVSKAQVGLGNVDNTADVDKSVLSATKWTTPRNIALTGDVTGNVNMDGSANVIITTTVQPNSVALGTDTTGNYVAGATAGTGISISGTAGEGWSPTITNTAPNVTTDISISTSTTSVTVNSSDGADGTIPSATTIAAGVMSAEDKTKLDGIATGATTNTGTVTSVATSGAITGGTITTSGTISHSTADGYLHVPATGTTNNGKVLTAGATAGSLSWTTLPTAPVTSVAGKTGAVTLVKGDVGLGNVDNIADASKSVLSATKLTTARTISLTGDVTGSVSFDGSADASISATITANSVALGTDTTGNYVAGVTQGTGISVTGTAGEGWTPVVSLTNVGTAGTYRSVTTDAQGRVTAGTNPTTLSGYGISDTYTKTEVDSLIGDINSALDTINGQVI